MTRTSVTDKLWFLLSFIYNISYSKTYSKEEVPFSVYTLQHIAAMKVISRQQRILYEIKWVSEFCNLLATFHLDTNNEATKKRIKELAKILRVKQITFFVRNIRESKNVDNSEQYRVMVTIGDENSLVHVIAKQTFLHRHLEYIETAGLHIIPEVRIENLLEKMPLATSTDEIGIVSNKSKIETFANVLQIVYLMIIIIFTSVLTSNYTKDRFESLMKVYSYKEYEELDEVINRLDINDIAKCWPECKQEEIKELFEPISLETRLTGQGNGIFILGPGGCGKTQTIEIFQDAIVKKYYELWKETNTSQEEEPEFCILNIGGSYFTNEIYVGDSKKRIVAFFENIYNHLKNNPSLVFIVVMNEFADFLQDPQSTRSERPSSMDIDTFKSELENCYKKLDELKTVNKPYARFNLLCTANPVNGHPDLAMTRRVEFIELYTTIDRNNMLEVFRTHLQHEIKYEQKTLQLCQLLDTAKIDTSEKLMEQHKDWTDLAVNEVQEAIDKYLDDLLHKNSFQDDNSGEKQELQDNFLDKNYNFVPSYLSQLAKQLVRRLSVSISTIQRNKGGQSLTGELKVFNGRLIKDITLLEIFEAIRDKHLSALINTVMKKCMPLNDPWLDSIKSEAV